MGLFGGNKNERKRSAEELRGLAQRQSTAAREFRAKAANLRATDPKTRWPDPAAVKAITRGWESNARICEANARDLRDMARRESQKWWQR